jgi:hypothetical protein
MRRLWRSGVIGVILLAAACATSQSDFQTDPAFAAAWVGMLQAREAQNAALFRDLLTPSAKTMVTCEEYAGIINCW